MGSSVVVITDPATVLLDTDWKTWTTEQRLQHGPTHPDSQASSVSSAPVTWNLFVVPFAIVTVLLASVFAIHQRQGASSPLSLGVLSNGAVAVNFTAASLNGHPFSLAAQRGRPVILFFMAASCTSCLIEAHALGQIQHKYGDRVRTVLIDIGKNDSSEALRTFVQRSAGPSRYWIFDADGTLARSYRVQTLETLYIVDRRSRIAMSWQVPLGFVDLDRAVRRTL